MDKVQNHNSFNTNTPSSESYKNYSRSLLCMESAFPTVVRQIKQKLKLFQYITKYHSIKTAIA
jgi:hypothetical protein